MTPASTSGLLRPRGLPPSPDSKVYRTELKRSLSLSCFETTENEINLSRTGGLQLCEVTCPNPSSPPFSQPNLLKAAAVGEAQFPGVWTVDLQGTLKTSLTSCVSFLGLPGQMATSRAAQNNRNA